MEFKYAHICDFATQGNNGKAIIVGVFDNVFALDVNNIGLPLCYLIAALTGRITEGTDHTVLVKLADEDGNEVFQQEMQVKVTPSPRRTLDGTVLLGLIGIKLPRLGGYGFDLFIDGQLKATIPLFVAEAPPQ